MGTLSIARDLWVAQRSGGAGIASRVEARLNSLVSHARTASPYFRDLYAHLPSQEWALRDLPSVTKQELMARFDDSVTDRAITRPLIEEYISDPEQVGIPMGGVFVCTSSGTTGHPGLFVHDARATQVYWSLPIVRGFGTWFGPGDWMRFLARGRREAQVIGVGAHFAGVAWAQRARLSRAGARRSLKVVAVNEPLPRMRAEVQAFDPAVLAGYPSAIDLLALEQLAGRLHLNLQLVATSGENLDTQVRDRLQSAFGCEVRDTYGTSETVFMAFECGQRWLHLSSDWFILEPVDEHGSPTPAGQYSHTTLMTNLANHLQPTVRYDIGDSVMMNPEECGCCSPFPAFRLAGRSSEVLHLRDVEGRDVSIPPLVIGTVVDATPGTCRTQVIQTGPASLQVRGDIAAGYAYGPVWDRLMAGLRGALDGCGLGNVRLELAPDEPEHRTAAGKFCRIVTNTTR